MPGGNFIISSNLGHQDITVEVMKKPKRKELKDGDTSLFEQGLTHGKMEEKMKPILKKTLQQKRQEKMFKNWLLSSPRNTSRLA